MWCYRKMCGIKIGGQIKTKTGNNERKEKFVGSYKTKWIGGALDEVHRIVDLVDGWGDQR